MNFQIEVNFWAVLVSGIASMVVGSIWYGPLFGKIFMREIGMDKWSAEKQQAEKKKMAKTYLVQFLASFLMFYIFALLSKPLGAQGLGSYMQIAFLVWLGFVVPTKLGDALWGGNIKLFWLGAGNMLVTLLAVGGILSMFG